MTLAGYPFKHKQQQPPNNPPYHFSPSQKMSTPALPTTTVDTATPSTASTKPPYGWTLSADPEGNTTWISEMGTQVYTLPTSPVYCTVAKVQEWIEFYDTTSHQLYYSNSFTGEHTFDTPPLYRKQLKEHLPFPAFQTSALRLQCCVRNRQALVQGKNHTVRPVSTIGNH